MVFSHLSELARLPDRIPLTIPQRPIRDPPNAIRRRTYFGTAMFAGPSCVQVWLLVDRRMENLLVYRHVLLGCGIRRTRQPERKGGEG